MIETDETLYGKLLAGDLAAFDRLYERYERPLFGFALAQLGDRAEAEDVLHEAFLAVVRAHRAGEQLRSFKAWLFTVARNLCLNRVRSRQRADRALALGGVAEVAEQPPPDEIDTSALHTAVGRLPPTLAEVYQLRATGLSYDEVAKILGIPLGTVKSRIHEMVARLREELS